MTKAILFDADGMIVNSERFTDRLENIYGISTELTRPFFTNEFQRCLVGQADLKEELAKHLGDWGWNETVDELMNFWFDEDANKIDDRFYPVLGQLREAGFKTYLATNNEKYRTDNLFVERGLNKYFDGVFSSSETGFKKTDVGFFQFALDKVGCDKKDVTFWDDDIHNVEAARSFGFQAELYKDFESFTEKIDFLL